MISTVVSMTAPSQVVIGFAIGGLLVILAAAQLLDSVDSKSTFLVRYVSVFSAPLLIWFAFIIFFKVLGIVI